jgi:hypothetical protein
VRLIAVTIGRAHHQRLKLTEVALPGFSSLNVLAAGGSGSLAELFGEGSESNRPETVRRGFMGIENLREVEELLKNALLSIDD